MWYGKITRLEKLSINSFIDNGHRYHLYLYDMENAKNVNPKVFIHDANDIFPEEDIFKNKDDINPFSQFADIFRLRLLNKEDYIWADLDNVCLSKDWKWDELFIPQMKRQEKDPYKSLMINNSLIKFKKESYPLTFLLNECEKFSVENSENRFDLSVHLFSTFFIENFDKYKKYIVPSNITFPINWNDIGKIYNKKDLLECNLATKQSFAIHLWRESLILNSLLDRMPEKGSWLYNAYQKHLPFSTQQDWQNL